MRLSFWSVLGTGAKPIWRPIGTLLPYIFETEFRGSGGPDFRPFVRANCVTLAAANENQMDASTVLVSAVVGVITSAITAYFTSKLKVSEEREKMGQRPVPKVCRGPANESGGRCQFSQTVLPSL
jgi:hypothetical protein